MSGRKLALGLAATSLLALGSLPACGGSASSGGPDGAATRAEVAVDNLEVTTPSLSAQVCAHLRFLGRDEAYPHFAESYSMIVVDHPELPPAREVFEELADRC